MANGGEGFDIPAGTIVIETAVDMEGMKRDLEKLEKEGRASAEEIEKSFAEGFEKAGAEGTTKGAREGLKKLGKGAEETSKKVEDADSSLDEWAGTADEAAQTAGGLGLMLSNRLTRGLKGFKGAVVRSTSSLLYWTSSGIQVAADGLQEMGEEMEASSSIMSQKFGPAVQVAGKGLSGFAGLVSQAAQAVTALKLIVIGSSTALDLAAANAADDFEQSWNRVLTLIPESVDRLDQLKREVSELGAHMGVTAETTNDTFYQVLSAMPEMARQPREALDILQVALETAATGFADGATAAKAITGVLNAFQMEADRAREVTDKLFAAQQQGVLTFQDIATEINKVSGITNALGGDFEDLLAIVSTMTGEFSARVPETFTQTRGLIRSIVDPSKEAAEAAKHMGEGFALSADLIRDHGLIGAIERIVEVTEGNPEAISKIIPKATAQQLIISLASRMDALEGRLHNINSTGGLTKETFEEVNQTWDRQKKIFTEQFKNDLRQIGFLYNDIRTNVLGAVNALRQMADHGKGGFADFLMESRDAGFELLDQVGQLGDRWHRATTRVTEYTDAVLDIPPSVAEVEDRTRRVERILSVLERNGFEVAEVFDLTNQNTDQWVDTLIESELALEDVEERVRRILRLQELAGPTPDVFAEQLTPRMAEQLGVDPEEMRREAEEDVESVDRPTSATEAQIAAIETRRARMRLEAFRDFLESGKEEAYQRRLEAIQREVNQLVADRVRLLQQHGAEAEDLQKLIQLYDTSIEKVDILSEEFAGLEESLKAVADRMGALEGEGPPLPPGMESEDDLVGFADSEFASKVKGLHDRLEELRESGASTAEIASEMQTAMHRAGISVEDLRDSSEGLAKVLVRQLLKAGIPAWFLGLEEGAAGAGEETSKLREDLQELATVANGILNVADALGVLGDDARQALRGVSDLAGALGQTAEEGEGFLGTGLTTGGFLGAVGAGVSIIGSVVSMMGESQAEQKLRQDLRDLRRSVDRLKSSIDAQRQALESVPGGLLARVQEALGGRTGAVVEAINTALDQLDVGDLLDVTQGSGGGQGVDLLRDAVLETLGLTPDQIEQVASELEGDFELLLDVLSGRLEELAPGDIERFIAQFEAFSEQAQTLDASDAFQNFEGQLQRLQTRIELFNIDEPAKKLERFLDLLLEFADLPEGAAQTLEGADLESAEGREAVLTTLQQLFERVAGGEEGLLGQMTLPQFRDLISRIQGLIEEGGGTERGGRAEEFTRTRTVTQVTAMRMVGILTTMDFRLQQLVAIGRQLVGGPGAPPNRIAPVPDAVDMVPARGQGGTSIDIGGVSTTVAEINVVGSDDPATVASAVREDLTDRVSREIADDILDRLRAAGVVDGGRLLRRQSR